MSVDIYVAAQLAPSRHIVCPSYALQLNVKYDVLWLLVYLLCMLVVLVD